jgi:hypothetical protein
LVALPAERFAGNWRCPQAVQSGRGNYARITDAPDRFALAVEINVYRVFDRAFWYRGIRRDVIDPDRKRSKHDFFHEIPY